MLLSKNEKKWNVIYLITLMLTVISFYVNILNNYKFFIATILSAIFLLVINILRYNTFNKTYKKILVCIYYILVIWIIFNKIYFNFFGDYINFVRITSASSPSIIVSAVFNVLKSLSLIILITSSITNLIALKKSKFRFKKLKRICIPTILIATALTLVLKTYNYEIISYMFSSSIDTGYAFEEYKPITTSNENAFEKLINKTHVENEYTNIAKGRNLILVQCESMQDTFTNKTYNNGKTEYVITPTVNELITKDSLYFDNCFAQIGWGNTSDAEFIVNNSFYPLAMQSIYQRCTDNYFYGLPKILKANGYSTNVYHGYVKDMWNRDKFYPVEGFDTYYHSENFPTSQFIGFGIADREFFKQTTSYMKKNTNDLRFDFVITLSSHTPYNTSPAMSDIVLKQSDKDSLFGKYIINMNYLDSAIDVLIKELKTKELYDNSIIVFYGDHHGLNLSDPDNYSKMTSYLGKPYSYDEMLNVPLIIHIPGLGKAETISTTCGQMDIMPTVLNMLGIENNTIYFGEDIMSIPEDSNRAIGGTTYMQAGSFIDKDHIFIMSKDSIYENATVIDRTTGGTSSSVVSREELYQKSKAIEEDVKLSNTITERNLLEALLNNNTIVLNDVNPQKYIFNINSDNDEYNYADRLNKAYEAGYNLVSVKVFKGDNNEFYISNKLNVFNRMTLVSFLELVKTYENVFVILTDIENYQTDLFRYLGKEHPDLAPYTIPEIYSLTGYSVCKTFNMNTPILCLDNLDITTEELLSFLANNDIFAAVSSKDKFKTDFVKTISETFDTFVYVKTVNDKGEITYFRDRNVNGYYTDMLELVTYNKPVITRFN